jgi:hypothetical protein
LSRLFWSLVIKPATLKSVAVDAEKFVQIRAFAFSRLKSSLLNDYINLTVEIETFFKSVYESVFFTKNFEERKTNTKVQKFSP